jgi:hypothetical protein
MQTCACAPSASAAEGKPCFRLFFTGGLCHSNVSRQLESRRLERGEHILDQVVRMLEAA